METARIVDCPGSEAKKVMACTGVAVGTLAVRPSLTTSARGTCMKMCVNNSQLRKDNKYVHVEILHHVPPSVLPVPPSTASLLLFLPVSLKTLRPLVQPQMLTSRCDHPSQPQTTSQPPCTHTQRRPSSQQQNDLSLKDVRPPIPVHSLLLHISLHPHMTSHAHLLLCTVSHVSVCMYTSVPWDVSAPFMPTPQSCRRREFGSPPLP